MTTRVQILHLLYVLHIVMLYIDVFVGDFVYELIIGYPRLSAVDYSKIKLLLQRV